MLPQPVPSLPHRCHCREYDVGAGVQLPFVTRSVSPTTAEPLNAGLTVFAGPSFDDTGSDASEVAVALPSVFDAVTATRSAWPTSPEVGV